MTHLNSMADQPPLDPASLEGLEPLLDRVFAADAPVTPPVVSPVPRPLSLARGKNPAVIDRSLIATEDATEDEDDGIFSGKSEIISSGSSAASRAADEVIVIDELRAIIDLLRAQLDYANVEMRASANRVRLLEAQLAAKDDQLLLLPDLLARASQLTVAEREMAVLREDADRLKVETAEMHKLSVEMQSGLQELLAQLELANRPWWQRILDLFRWSSD